MGIRTATMNEIPRLRVATYNIHKCRGLDRRTNPSRIAKMIRQLDADVVALQEVLDVRSGRPEHDQARSLACELEGYHWTFGENRQLHGGAYGNMTLSRMPFSFQTNYDLTWRHRERRGCLRTDVSFCGMVLHIFNVHLGTGFMERRHQARKLLSDRVLKQTLTGRKIVVGDFNEWTRGLASRLMGSDFKCAEPRSFMRYGRTYPGILPFMHLDHFYFDPALRLVKLKLHRTATALVASDHLPLVAEFGVERG
jgi:endonuclease/exonuclease/phosphatase family metal-dependent hydrolase